MRYGDVMWNAQRVGEMEAAHLVNTLRFLLTRVPTVFTACFHAAWISWEYIQKSKDPAYEEIARWVKHKTCDLSERCASSIFYHNIQLNNGTHVSDRLWSELQGETVVAMVLECHHRGLEFWHHPPKCTCAPCVDLHQRNAQYENEKTIVQSSPIALTAYHEKPT